MSASAGCRHWGRPRDFNARGRYCHGAGVERATSFPFDTASIGRTLASNSSATRAASSITIRLAAAYPRIVPSVPSLPTILPPMKLIPSSRSLCAAEVEAPSARRCRAPASTSRRPRWCGTPPSPVPLLPLQGARRLCLRAAPRRHRRKPLVERRSERNLPQGYFGRDCIGAENKHHGVCARDQRLDALPPLLERVDVGAVDQWLEAARLEGRLQLVGKPDVLAAVGDENLGPGLVRLLNSGIGHRRAPHGALGTFSGR